MKKQAQPIFPVKGWTVVIRRKNSTYFIASPYRVYLHRKQALAYAKQCKQHGMDAVTRRAQIGVQV